MYNLLTAGTIESYTWHVQHTKAALATSLGRDAGFNDAELAARITQAVQSDSSWRALSPVDSAAFDASLTRLPQILFDDTITAAYGDAAAGAKRRRHEELLCPILSPVLSSAQPSHDEAAPDAAAPEADESVSAIGAMPRITVQQQHCSEAQRAQESLCSSQSNDAGLGDPVPVTCSCGDACVLYSNLSVPCSTLLAAKCLGVVGACLRASEHGGIGAAAGHAADSSAQADPTLPPPSVKGAVTVPLPAAHLQRRSLAQIVQESLCSSQSSDDDGTQAGASGDALGAASTLHTATSSGGVGVVYCATCNHGSVVERFTEPSASPTFD